MSSAASRFVCFRCKSDQSGPKRPMLRCSSCKKGWHTYCHSPVITLGQYKAMYEAEMSGKAGLVRFSTWRCSPCSDRQTTDEPALVISSDEEEVKRPQPRPTAGPSKSVSPAAVGTSTEDVIDLTEGFAGLAPQKGKTRARDTSTPRSRSQTLDLPRREEYRSSVTRMELQSQNPPPTTPPPPSGPTVIINEDGADPKNGTAHPAPTTSLASEPSRQMEIRLLPQIIKEEAQELVIPPFAATSEVSRRPRKPKKTTRFVPTSRKGKQRIKGFVNLHMPFGPEPLPKVDLGTLEEALRKLGLEPSSG